MADFSWGVQASLVSASWAQYEAALDKQINAQNDWNAAYTAAAGMAQAAALFQAAQQVIIAGLQLEAAKYAADKQYEIANRQMNMAEEEHNRYKAHFWCVENTLADDACTEVLYVPDYNTRADRSALDVRKQFALQRQQLVRLRQRYCLTDFSHEICDLAAQEAKAIADVRDKAYRYEESRRDAFDDRRFNRRVTVANFGRGLQAGSVQLMQQGSQIALGAINTQLAGTQQALGAVSGAISGIIGAAFRVPETSGNNYSSQYVSQTGGFQSANSWTPIQGYSGGGIFNQSGAAAGNGLY